MELGALIARSFLTLLRHIVELDRSVIRNCFRRKKSEFFLSVQIRRGGTLVRFVSPRFVCRDTPTYYGTNIFNYGKK